MLVIAIFIAVCFSYCPGTIKGTQKTFFAPECKKYIKRKQSYEKQNNHEPRETLRRRSLSNVRSVIPQERDHNLDQKKMIYSPASTQGGEAVTGITFEIFRGRMATQIQKWVGYRTWYEVLYLPAFISINNK